MDSYQAIYDAVRDANLDHWARLAADGVAYAHTRPSLLYRPTVTVDGDMWCALYGENLQDGVAGFGESPALAMEDFDRAWFARLDAAKGVR